MEESGDPCWSHPKILGLQVRFVETSSRTPPAPWPTKPGYNMCHNVGLACRSRRLNSLVVQLRCAALEACSWREGTHVWWKTCGNTFCSAPEVRCRCALSTRLHSRYTPCRQASRARKTLRAAKRLRRKSTWPFAPRQCGRWQFAGISWQFGTIFGNSGVLRRPKT